MALPDAYNQPLSAITQETELDIQAFLGQKWYCPLAMSRVAHDDLP